MTMCDHYEGMRENCSKKSFFHTLEGLQGLIFWLRGQHFEPIALRTLSHRLMHRTRNIEGRKAYFIGYMTNRLLLGIEPSRKRVLFIVKVSVTLSPCGCLIFLILFVILMEAKHFEYFFGAFWSCLLSSMALKTRLLGPQPGRRSRSLWEEAAPVAWLDGRML